MLRYLIFVLFIFNIHLFYGSRFRGSLYLELEGKRSQENVWLISLFQFLSDIRYIWVRGSITIPDLYWEVERESDVNTDPVGARRKSLPNLTPQWEKQEDRVSSKIICKYKCNCYCPVLQLIVNRTRWKLALFTLREQKEFLEKSSLFVIKSNSTVIKYWKKNKKNIMTEDPGKLPRQCWLLI